MRNNVGDVLIGDLSEADKAIVGPVGRRLIESAMRAVLAEDIPVERGAGLIRRMLTVALASAIFASPEDDKLALAEDVATRLKAASAEMKGILP